MIIQYGIWWKEETFMGWKKKRLGNRVQLHGIMQTI